MSDSNLPSGETVDNDYVSRTGQKDHMPVVGDKEAIEDPIDANTADSDAQLGMPEHYALQLVTKVLMNLQRPTMLMPSISRTLSTAAHVELQSPAAVTPSRAMMRVFHRKMVRAAPMSLINRTLALG